MEAERLLLPNSMWHETDSHKQPRKMWSGKGCTLQHALQLYLLQAGVGTQVFSQVRQRGRAHRLRQTCCLVFLPLANQNQSLKPYHHQPQCSIELRSSWLAFLIVFGNFSLGIR